MRTQKTPMAAHMRLVLACGFALLPFFPFSEACAVTDSFAASGSWVAPAGVTSVTVEAWGGGGAGGGQNLTSDGGGGGGGGAYSKAVSVTVTPGNSYTVSVGVGGAGVASGTGGTGGDSYFINMSTVLAKGGAGGARSTGTPPAGGSGGAAASGVGGTKYSGGNGGKGRDNATGQGGPGGSSAGTAANGTSGPATWATLTAAAPPAGGGIGGDGGVAGANGSAPASGNGGGGGGSGDGTARVGGAGADGLVTITYEPPTVATGAASALTSRSATLNGTVTSNAAAATVTFNYGLTTAYGSVVTAAQSPVAAGTTATAVSAGVTGLVCNTLYHYRVVGVNSVGTTNGGDLTLTTAPCPGVTSITVANINPNTANSTVSWIVLFSTSVTGVDASDFALISGGGVTGAAITSVTGSGTTWTVNAGTGTAYGTLGLNLLDNDSIVDTSGSVLGGVGAGNGNFAGQVYTLAAPVLLLSKVASASAAAVGDLVTFTITASNPYGADMSAVTVKDVLPTGMTFAAQVTTLGTVSVTGQTVTWAVPTIPANGSAQLNLVVTLAQTGTLVNTVTSPGALSASASVLSLTSAVTSFHLDEPVGSWNGTAGEVLDSGGTGLHGRRVTTTAPTTTNTVSPMPTIASQYPAVVGGFCNAAQFDGKAVVEVPNNVLFNYTTKLSASAWIYPTAYPGSDYYAIFSNDQNYEFQLSSAGKLYWWWGSSSFTSATTIPLNQWTHIGITFDSTAAVRRQRIYINGVLDPNTNNWQGTLATNPCNFYIGGDVATGSCALIPGRNFRGSIDEVKLYTYELSAAEVQADMTLGRNCSGTYDHIQIEHDGSGSICTPETITVKACLNAACSTLYPGNVTVNLSPTGWVGGDTVTLTNGIGTRSLIKGTAGSVTLGTTGAAPIAANPTRCFNGATETCAMNFVSASCAFDAVEPSAAPKTRLFTKLAGANFNVDLLALTASATVNTAYTGTVAVDLVDTSSVTCPAGSGLNTAANIVFSGADSGRKQVSFNYTQAAANVRVRMKVGAAAAACSTDNFAIRPQQFSVTSPTLNNTALTGTPKDVAGNVFTVNAAAGVTGGYSGTAPVLDASKVQDHNSAVIATGTLSGNFAAGTGAAAQGTAFKYLDVGNILFTADAVVDSSFTSVDQSTDCVSSSTSNTLNAAGKYGCNIGSAASAKMGRWHPSHYSFSGALTAGCPAGGFTYMDQDALGVVVTLKAHATTGATPSATDPVTSRYTAGYANLASVTLSGDNNGVAVAASRLGNPAFPAMPNATMWTAGQFQINDIYSFGRLVSPDGAYDLFKLKAALSDLDGSLLIGAAAAQETNATKIRWGRVRMQNKYGSGKLPLAIPVQAQYWSGSAFVLNTDDSCTVVTVPTALSQAPNGQPNLYFDPAGGKNQLASTDTTPTMASPLVGGSTTLQLTTPGKAGWLDIILGVPDYLKDNWGNCMGQSGAPGLRDDFPCARATFGVYKSPLIYRRENY